MGGGGVISFYENQYKILGENDKGKSLNKMRDFYNERSERLE